MHAIYLRVSTVEQSKSDRSSLSEQERVCRGAALMRGAGDDDVKVFSDPGVSGSIALAKRPGGKQMLSELKTGDTIICAKLDRAFRSATDALSTLDEMREKGIGVVICDMGVDAITGNGVARLLFSILAACAEFERNRITERMEEGRRAKAARGGHRGGQPPFGYAVVGEGREAVLVEHEGEQRVLELVTRMSGTMSLARISAELDRRGLRSRKGVPFYREQVKRMIERVTAQAAE